MIKEMSETKAQYTELVGQLGDLFTYGIMLGGAAAWTASDPFCLTAHVMRHTNDLRVTLTGLHGFRFKTLVPSITSNVQTDLERFIDNAAPLLADSILAHVRYPEVTL